MTEPTDAEIAACIDAAQIKCVHPDAETTIEIARAVLAKWGTPPAVAGEPVAWRYVASKVWGEFVYTEDPKRAQHARDNGIDVQPVFTAPHPTQAQAVNQDDRPFIVRLAEDFAEDCVTAGYVTTKAASYGRLMDEALSTQPQAGAVPLTDEQIRAMCKESWVFETVKQWVRITEQHHGIKGGQHGTE